MIDALDIRFETKPFGDEKHKISWLFQGFLENDNLTTRM